MADIFISFSTADAARVRPIYDAFKARGLTVFWSNDIPAGVPDYHAVIKDEIRKAPVVVVVWTHNSITSHPVSQECSQAERDNKLIQVLIDDIEPIDFPMEVRFRAQKTFLMGWTGDPQHSGWVRLNDALDGRLGRSAGPQPQPASPASPRPQSSEAERDWRAHDLDTCNDPGLLKAYQAKWQNSDFVWAYKAQQKAAAVEAAERERQAREAAEQAVERERQAREAAVHAASERAAEEARLRAAAEAQVQRERAALIESYRREGRLPAEPGAGKVKWFKDLDFSPEMVVVPPGVFRMGEGDNAHEVGIEAPFAIGRFALTFAEWDAAQAHRDWQRYSGIAPRKPNDHPWGRGKQPVIDVSWEDAQAYCAWLSKLTSRTYRLPSEAEWEYCCRAGTTTEFWWGDEISTTQANYNGNYTYKSGKMGEYRKRTVPVDSFQPNSWGLYQVHGNVWEWCEDSDDASSRVLRGGSWNYVPRSLRAADRDRFQPGGRINYAGFRVARTL